jgi:hypothetical protein
MITSRAIAYRDGVAHIPRIRDNWWLDFGWIRINGDPYRVAVRTNDEVVRLSPPTGPFGTTMDSDFDDDESWLARRIAAGIVERVDPNPPTSTYERRSYANLPPRWE